MPAEPFAAKNFCLRQTLKGKYQLFKLHNKLPGYLRFSQQRLKSKFRYRSTSFKPYMLAAFAISTLWQSSFCDC